VTPAASKAAGGESTRPTARLRALLGRHPLPAFYALACALSWWPMLREGNGLFPLGPFLAALVVTALAGGRAGLTAYLRRLARWRAGLGWYAAALLVPVALSAGAAGLNVVLGAPAPSAARLARWPEVIPTFLVYLVALGGMEEPGWRGFAMPGLRPGRSALAASLALGALIAAWHLPLVRAGMQPVPSLLGAAAAQVLYTWLSNRASPAGGNVLIVMVAHAAQGGIGGELFSGLFAGPDAVRMGWLLAAAYTATALLLALATGPALAEGRRPARRDASAPDAPAPAGR
jgi:membrane protease YdiL (CAAX protease family)